jgi:protein-tyrosine-phosphatase
MSSSIPRTPWQVLFLCTHNSARSILAEGLLQHLGQGAVKVQAHSAGSSPRPNQQPNPLALRTLAEAGIATDGLHSKSWDVFGGSQAASMDLIITVCDNAAGEVCPYWPGHPATAHWGYADPSALAGSEEDRLQAFRNTLARMGPRMQALVQMLAQLDADAQDRSPAQSRSLLQAWAAAQGNDP